MDAVNGIASVSQLVIYSHSAIKQLTKLYSATQGDAGFYQAQRCNLKFLLQTIQNICIHPSSGTERLLPLLVDTADLATSLIRLLKPQSFLARSLLWFVKSQEIESAFNTLNEKTRLLQLHISESTHTIVTHIQKDIKDMSEFQRMVRSNSKK